MVLRIRVQSTRNDRVFLHKTKGKHAPNGHFLGKRERKLTDLCCRRCVSKHDQSQLSRESIYTHAGRKMSARSMTRWAETVPMKNWPESIVHIPPSIDLSHRNAGGKH